MAAVGRPREGVAERAAAIEGLERGEPETMVRFEWEGSLGEEGSRTRAMMVWFWERRVERTWVPVRPVEPRRRKCIV